MCYKYIFSFRKKTLLAHTFVWLICFVLFLVSIRQMIHYTAKRSLEAHTQELIHHIHSLSHPDGMIRFLSTKKTFYQVTLCDDLGHTLYDSHDTVSLLKDSDPEILNALKYGRGYECRFVPPFNQSMVYSAQLFDFHGHDYVLRVGSSFTEMSSLSHDFEIRFLALGILLFGFHGAIIWVIILRISRPLQKMVSAIQPYQEGKQDFISPIDLKNEQSSDFVRLAQIFNTLNQRIQEQIHHLVDQRECNQEILESLGEGIVAIGSNGMISFINQAACRMLGVTQESILVHRFKEAPTHRRELISLCQELIERSLERLETLTHTHRIEESPKMYFHLIISPQKQHGGVILVIQNKTADHEMVEMGKEFIANASHELRTPITIIQGFAEILHDTHKPSSEQQKEFAQKILKTCTRLNILVKSLLTLADLESVEEEHFQWTDLTALTETCRQTLQVTHPGINPLVTLNTQQTTVWADPALLVMALTNLLENAVKYSPAPAHIEISIDQSSDSLLWTIKDQGIGIPETDLPHIFDRFYTVNKARSRKFGGTGLGLSIVKAITQKHRGTISVHSQVGAGSSFTIKLPYNTYTQRT